MHYLPYLSMDVLKGVLSKEETLPILLKRYNHLKKNTSKKEFVELFKENKQQIEQDLPRTYGNSKWVKNSLNKEHIFEILKCFFVYNKNIGYLQGMLFLLIPLIKLFEQQLFLAFWVFVKMIENLETLYTPLIFKDVDMLDENVESVFDKWLQLRVHHVKPEMVIMIKQLIRWKFMSTMFFSLIGTNLNNMDLVLNYFMKHIHDEEEMLRKSCALSLALLLCFFKDRQITTEDIQLLSTCYLSENALLAVIDCAQEVDFLF